MSHRSPRQLFALGVLIAGCGAPATPVVPLPQAAPAAPSSAVRLEIPSPATHAPPRRVLPAPWLARVMEHLNASTAATARGEEVILGVLEGALRDQIEGLLNRVGS